MRVNPRLGSLFIIVNALIASVILGAFDHQGQVRFGELPAPGAVVQATQADKTFRTLTDANGRYSLPQLNDGIWSIQVEAPGFESIRRDVTILPDAPVMQWELRMLPIERIQGTAAVGFTKSLPAPAASLQISTPEPEAAVAKSGLDERATRTPIWL